MSPEFVLNRLVYKNTTILFGRDNIGCGSSREHAVWALAEYGIRCIIAPSFGSIFYQNCIRNGVLPVVLDNDTIIALANQVQADPQANQVTINLERQQVIDSCGNSYNFAIATNHRHMLLNGLDVIGLTLELDTQIQNFEQAYQQTFPWLYSAPEGSSA